jgi:hypothetical protein
MEGSEMGVRFGTRWRGHELVDGVAVEGMTKSASLTGEVLAVGMERGENDE